jgi:hypothetical protein
MADFMVNHLAVRFTVFMGRWDGSPTADHQALMKTAMIILKLQAACLKSERAALEIPQLRWKARLEQEKRDELLAAYEEHKEEQAEEVLKEFMESYEAKMKKEEAKKAKKKPSQSDAQSSPIKAAKGSRKKPGSRKPTEPTVIENVKFDEGHQISPSSEARVENSLPAGPACEKFH